MEQFFGRGLLMRFLAVTVLLGSLTIAGAPIAETQGSSGAVYAMTNSALGNNVVVFTRAADGSLQQAKTYSTGGRGTQEGLGSQGALILSQDNRWLYAANAGSNEISVFAISPSSNSLRLIQRLGTGGVRPISLTQHGNLLYALHGGGGGNITGFTVGTSGTLSPLANSTRPLSGPGANPAQVSFSPDGTTLVVTEKGTSLITTYTVGADGRPGNPMPQPSNGVEPFGFLFRSTGQLIVSEAFLDLPNQSAASSYRLSPGAKLQVISGSVKNGQTAACWVAISEPFAFTANTASGTISSYSIGGDGSLTLAQAVAAAPGAPTAPQDLAMVGSYLYVLNPGSGTVGAYRVTSTGLLTPINQVPGLPVDAGAQGLAAR